MSEVRIAGHEDGHPRAAGGWFVVRGLSRGISLRARNARSGPGCGLGRGRPSRPGDPAGAPAPPSPRRTRLWLTGLPVLSACPRALLGVSAVLLLSGCGPGGAPPVSEGGSPGRNAPAAKAPVPKKVELRKIEDLSTTKDETGFAIAAQPQSEKVVEYYDQKLAAEGWKKVTPEEDGPGQRKWLSTGAKVGPTSAYDAAWKDPKTGRVAVLSIWHEADEPNVQHGTFEIHDKNDSPL